MKRYLLYVAIGLLAQPALLLLSVVAGFHENAIFYPFYALPSVLIMGVVMNFFSMEIPPRADSIIYVLIFIALLYSHAIAAGIWIIKYAYEMTREIRFTKLNK